MINVLPVIVEKIELSVVPALRLHIVFRGQGVVGGEQAEKGKFFPGPVFHRVELLRAEIEVHAADALLKFFLADA